MFPDSEVAKKFSSGLVKHTLAPAFNSRVVTVCQSSPFSILCDGGNDQIRGGSRILRWFLLRKIFVTMPHLFGNHAHFI